MRLSPNHPLELLLDRSLVYLGSFLSYFHDEHAVVPASTSAVSDFLRCHAVRDVSGAVWQSGAAMCYGIWNKWIMTAVGSNKSEVEQFGSAERIHAVLLQESIDLVRPLGQPVMHNGLRPLPPSNSVAREVRRLKEQFFGVGMARDMTVMLADHRLAEIWGHRGRLFLYEQDGPDDISDWMRLVRQQMRTARSDHALRRLIRVGNVHVAAAIAMAFDSVEILVRRKAKSDLSLDETPALVVRGLLRLAGPIAWPSHIALAREIAAAGQSLR